MKLSRREFIAGISVAIGRLFLLGGQRKPDGVVSYEETVRQPSGKLIVSDCAPVWSAFDDDAEMYTVNLADVFRDE